MGGGKSRVLLLLFICMHGCARGCDTWAGIHEFEGKCFKEYSSSYNREDAGTLCSGVAYGLLGEWRLPTIDEIKDTGLEYFWVLGQDPEGCYGAASTRDGKYVRLDCNALNGVVCIQVSGDIQPQTNIQGQLSLSEDGIPEARNIQQDLLVMKVNENVQNFENLAVFPPTHKRKKRQVLSRRRNLTGAQRTKLQSAKTRVRTRLTQGSKTVARKLVNTRRKTVQNVPAAQTVQAGPSTQVDQVPSSEGTKSKAGGRQKSKQSRKQEEKGKDMCMKGWKKAGDCCLYFSDDTLTWMEAKDKCETFIYNGSEASLVNLGEESISAWFDRKAEKIAAKYPRLWTSGNDLREELALQWTDSDPLVVPEMSPGNNSPDRDCVVLMDADLLQYDQCSESYNYVCQMKEPDITEEDLIR